MFPLADAKGHVLGFGARALAADDQPKYLNTSESELFHKGSLVYGADLARAAAARAGRLVLVEGYTDVIALRQAGIPETVCSMGTALTERQLDALKRLTPKVLLCQDPDAAGQEAVAKGKDAIRVFNEGAPRCAASTCAWCGCRPGSDPADVVQQRRGRGDARAARDVGAGRALRGRAGARARPTSSTPEGRDDALRAVAPVVGRLEPGPLQYDLIQLDREPAADAGGDDEEALRRAPRDERRRDGGRPPPRAARPATSADRREDTERLFLARCLAIKDAGPPRARGDGHRRVVLARADAPRRALPRRAPRAPRASRCPRAPTTSRSWSPSS